VNDFCPRQRSRRHRRLLQAPRTTTRPAPPISIPPVQGARLISAGSALKAVRSILDKSKHKKKECTESPAAAAEEPPNTTTPAMESNRVSLAAGMGASASTGESGCTLRDVQFVEGSSAAAEFVAAHPSSSAKELVDMLSTMENAPDKREVINAFLAAQGARGVEVPRMRNSKKEPSALLPSLERFASLNDIPMIYGREAWCGSNSVSLSSGDLEEASAPDLKRMPRMYDIPVVRCLTDDDDDSAI